MVTIKFMVPSVTFTGNELVNGTIRACAGGVDDHAAVDPNPDTTKRNDSQYRAHTRLINLEFKANGKVVPNAKFTLRFDNNKGHSYGNNVPLKSARLHRALDPFDDAHPWQESLEMQTDAKGVLPQVWVLSSDVINQPKLRVILKPVTAPKEPVVLGEIACDFAAPTSFRHFINRFDPEELVDTGWIFDFPSLNGPDNTTPAKVYMKFRKDRSDSAPDAGNWQYVNDHFLRVKVAKALMADGTTEAGTPTEMLDYAYIVDSKDAQSADPINTEPSTVIVKTGRYVVAGGSKDGAAQATVHAGSGIGQVDELEIGAEDLTIWDQ